MQFGAGIMSSGTWSVSHCGKCGGLKPGQATWIGGTTIQPCTCPPRTPGLGAGTIIGDAMSSALDHLANSDIPQGWLCPRCDVINAPHREKCDCRGA